jgi:hypothetical protein
VWARFHRRGKLTYLSIWFVVVGFIFGFRLFVELGARLARYAKALNVLAGCSSP